MNRNRPIHSFYLFAVLILVATICLNSCSYDNSLFDAQSGGSTVLYYRFDETGGSTATDSSGNGLDGTIYGAPRVPGKVGQGLQLGSPGQRVEIPRLHDYLPGQELTVDIWINPATISPSAIYQIVGNGLAAATFSLRINDGHVEFLIADSFGGVQSIITSVTSLNTGTWYYVAVTFDGSAARLYLNGALDNSSSVPYPLPGLFGGLFIGPVDGTSTEFIGIVDELRIFSIVLSDTEIAGYYQQTNM